MQAIVVGTKRLSFIGKDNSPVRMTKYFLNVPEDNVEGHGVDTMNWNEVTKGKPPAYGIGEVIDVEYSKTGKLTPVIA